MTTGLETLSPMRQRAVDQLLIEYLELPEQAQAAWLRQTVQRLPRLGRWLDRLVAESNTVTFLDDSVRRLAGESVDRLEINIRRLAPGDRLGPWEVIAEVGQGGMGRVYRGRRADGAFDMEVAIKQIGRRRRGLAELLQRECRLLARLDHPSVTRLVDAGLDDQAGPFLVMEWVAGENLTDWIKREDTDQETRLKLFQHIAEAVAHAHQRLIVHGDIKPDNIRIRDDGVVKLMDFGVARLLESGQLDQPGPRALTPAFAAPEQRAGEEITPASDIWSLGALLQWLLYGPQRSHEGRAGLRARELAAIADKACEDEPERRYSSVDALLTDLNRFRTALPVEALAGGRLYRARRFIRRHGLATTLSAMVVLALSAGAVVSLWQAQFARAEADRAEAVGSFLADMFTAADPFQTPGESLTVESLLAQNVQRIRTQFVDQPQIALELLDIIGQAQKSLARLDDAQETFRAALQVVDAWESRDAEFAQAMFTYNLASAIGSPEDRFELLTEAERLVESQLHRGWEARRLNAHINDLIGVTFYHQGDLATALKRSVAASDVLCTDWAIEQDPADCNSVLSDQFYLWRSADEDEKALGAASQAYDLSSLIARQGGGQYGVFTTGMAYGIALVEDNRHEEGIDILLETRDMLDAYAPEHPTVASFLDYRLAWAHAYTGQTDLAIETWRDALTNVYRHDPEDIGVQVQLELKVDELIELWRLDDARTAYENYPHNEPDQVPPFARFGRRFNHKRIVLHESPDTQVSPQTWNEWLGEASEVYPTLKPWIRREALEHALNTGDIDAAAVWAQTLASDEAALKGSVAMSIAKARFHLAAGTLDQASHFAERAKELVNARSIQQGPFLARLTAILAGISCHSGDLESGQRSLTEATTLWSASGGHPDGIRQLLSMGEGC